MKRKNEIICEKCGAVYLSDGCPEDLKCICLCEEFKVVEVEA